MSAVNCYLCAQDSLERRRYGLADGADCPICYQPTCHFHLTTVRWRWRANGEIDTARICRECKRNYAHRTWDVANRDWIT